MAIEIDRDSGDIQPADRMGRGGLYPISAGLRGEILEEGRACPPEPNHVTRGVAELVLAKLRGSPIARLQLLIEIELEIVFDRRGERTFARA